ncbi:unnamed protein product [Cylicocyclus nassatus]|uniref:MADF domain-containing protein n=1 Tax=Cylicocyclus nassatus TaxID=53992 RepID=A0AA36GP05_CYLNA|nr:unnamed protein product [Cylicocyclus nassatus]
MVHDLKIDLITLVEEQGAIWNVSCDDYRVAERRNSAWLETSQNMWSKGHECPVADAKRMWKSLRDTYRKHKTARTGSATVQPWVYMKHLRFLDTCETTVYSEAAKAVKARMSALEVEKQNPSCKFEQYGQFVTTYLKSLPDNVAVGKMSLMTNTLLEPVQVPYKLSTIQDDLLLVLPNLNRRAEQFVVVRQSGLVEASSLLARIVLLPPGDLAFVREGCGGP